MDLITFQEEYCNIPWGENSDAYFKLIMFDRTRNIKKAFYPQRKTTIMQKRIHTQLRKLMERSACFLGILQHARAREMTTPY